MKETSITPRGRGWERKQSGWIVASAFGLGGPAMIFAGAKVRLKRWMMSGLGYSLVEFGLPILFGLNKFTLLASLGAWLVSFINSLVVRKEYLIRLDAVTNIMENDLRRQIARDYGADPRQLGDGLAGYIPPKDGSYVQLHDQDFGIKHNATPLVRGKPVHRESGLRRSAYYSDLDPQSRKPRPQQPVQPSAPEPPPAPKQPENKFAAEPEIYEHSRLMQLDDYFRPRRSRIGANVYFYRFGGYNSEIGRFIRSFCEAAERKGLVVDRKLPPPGNEALLQYENTIGREFRVSEDFVVRCMVRWLPKVEPVRRRRLARSMYNTLVIMQDSGMSDTQLRNSYIKFMCWINSYLYGVVSALGEEQLPKLLFEGTPDRDELMTLNLISDAGCDVVLLLTDGESGYKSVDPRSEISYPFVLTGMKPFPEGYSLRELRGSRDEELRNYREGRDFIYTACTNTWSSGRAVDDIAAPPDKRGGDPRSFYNVFARIKGVRERGSYLQELYDLYNSLKRSGRGVAVISGSFDPPSNEEKMSLRGGTSETADQLIAELAAKIQYGLNPGLQLLMARSFTELMKAQSAELSLRELRECGVNVLCYLRRFMSVLFPAWEMPQVGAFLKMGGCKTDSEALFLRLLASLPVDVLILLPAMDDTCCLYDMRIQEFSYNDFLEVERFPTDPSLVRVGTAAYHAERELDSLLYEDSGLYRSRQFTKANAVTLRTMYEEVALFWREELKYRPNFGTEGDSVNMPVLFSKISGVKDGDLDEYWEGIYSMMTADTVLVSRVPLMKPGTAKDLEYGCKRFLDRGQLQRQLITADPAYRWRHLRTETQQFMLDKLQQLMDSRVIKGMFAGSGIEFRVMAVVLSLDDFIVRTIQGFDFTKTNPKLIYIQADEEQPGLEDAVVAAYLNLIGFDIAFFVPTGYQSIERYYATDIMEEHQAGDYMYGLTVPDLRTYVPRTSFEKWQDRRRKNR